jgi:hypothetical protein
MVSELEPAKCAICGGFPLPEIKARVDHTVFAVQCNGCSSRVEAGTLEEAMAAWARRQSKVRNPPAGNA